MRNEFPLGRETFHRTTREGSTVKVITDTEWAGISPSKSGPPPTCLRLTETASEFANVLAAARAIRDLVPKEQMIFANGADIDAFKDWNGALIEKVPPGLSYLTTHFVIGMNNLKDETQPDVPYLDVVATTDSHRGDLTVFVVNRNWKAASQAAIRIKGFHPAVQATVRRLHPGSILDGNNEEHSEVVRQVTSTLPVSGDTTHYTFPEHSLTEISFTSGGEPCVSF